MDVGLRYVGKKLPFDFENPILGEGNKLHFVDRKTVVRVNSEIADWIFKYNPTGFVEKVPLPEIATKQPEVVDTKAQMPEPVSEPELICPHCFKQYSDKKWFVRHLKKCADEHPEEPEDDAA